MWRDVVMTTSPSVPDEDRVGRIARWLPRIVLVVFALFVLIQLIPNRVENHQVKAEPKWDAPRTRELAVAACYDCHSNQTKTVWYEKVAPVSWWIKNHVDEGRAALNYSECGTRREEGDESAETISEGSMPPSYYTWFGLHSGAKLSASEKRALADGLTATAKLGCQTAP